MTAGSVVPRAPLRQRVATVLAVLRRGNRRLVAVLLVLLALDSLAGAAQSVALKWIVDAAVDGQWPAAVRAALLGGVATGVLGSVGRVVGSVQNWIGFRLAVDIDTEVLELAGAVPGVEHLERAEYLDEVRLVRESGRAMVASTLATTMLASLALRIAVSVWLLATIHPVFVAMPLFAVPSVVLATRARRHVDTAAERTAEAVRASGGLQALFGQPAAAMELRIFGCADALDARAHELWADVRRRRLRGALRAAALQSAGWLVLALAYVCALLFIAALAARGRATAGDILLVSSLTLQLRWYLASASTVLGEASGAGRLADRLIWLAAYARSSVAAAGTAPPPSSLASGVSFEGVTFTYPGRSSAALDSVDLVLPAGATVAVVGENGAGKTTLLKLLCGFYQPDAGRILVDGVPVASLDPAAWRGCLSGSFQDFVRVETVARHSVGCGDPPRMDDDAAVGGALERADASLLVGRWPGGLETLLGKTHSDGEQLSGGQWQQVAIARGMMRRRPLVLLLDEPTSALDAAAEDALYERYAGRARSVAGDGGITVIVSHRLASLSLADLIVVMGDGRVVEAGTHAELLRRDGAYARMFREQASAYR